jgi:hypothetical protein
MNAVAAAFLKFPPAGLSPILFVILAVAFGLVTNKNILSFGTATGISLFSMILLVVSFVLV